MSRRLKSFNITTIPKMIYSLTDVVKRGKDRVSLLDRINVIYKLQCLDCNASYVGETKRSLGTRVHEHSRDSKNPLKDTPIFRHISELDHNFDFDNPAILDTESNYFKRITSEMIHINSQVNGINIQEDFPKLNSLYTPLLIKLKK